MKSWPLGDYLRQHREALGLSQRKAANRARISGSRWRQVEMGEQTIAGGQTIAVNPKPETVAAMARAVEADVGEALRLAGYDPNRFGWLTETVGVDMPYEVQEWFTRLPRPDRDIVIADMQRLSAAIALRETGRFADSRE